MSFTRFRMTFPIIKIKDKQFGDVHIVGTNPHDLLYVGEDGQLHYGNLQNGDGSGADDEYGYIFTGENDVYSPYPQVEFVTLGGLLEIIKEQAELSAEHERNLRNLLANFWNGFDDEVEKSLDDGFAHS